MKIFKKYAFTLLALITLAQTPQTNAVDWDWLKEFAVTAPLEHPYAFCTPCFPNAVTLAALYALKNYQNTISPLCAYATLPLFQALKAATWDAEDMNLKERAIIGGYTLFCNQGINMLIVSVIGLAEAYYFF